MDKRAPARSPEPTAVSPRSYEPKRSGGSTGEIETQPEEAEHTRLRRERMERRARDREARDAELKKNDDAGIQVVRSSSRTPTLRKPELQQAEATIADKVEKRLEEDAQKHQVPERQDVDDFGEKGGQTAQQRDVSVFDMATPGDRTPTRAADAEYDEWHDADQGPGFGATLTRRGRR